MNTLTVFLMLNLAALHPMHISYTNLDMNPETGEIKLVCKFYTDDLKLLFYHFYDRQLLFDPEKELPAEDIELISRYLFSSFMLKEPDGKVVNFSFMRKEQNEESLWLYFNGNFSQHNPGSILLMNTLLLDLFEDQKNLVIILCGEFERGYSFDYQSREFNIDMSNIQSIGKDRRLNGV